jgi:hypothetical protein
MPKKIMSIEDGNNLQLQNLKAAVTSGCCWEEERP